MVPKVAGGNQSLKVHLTLHNLILNLWMIPIQLFQIGPALSNNSPAIDSADSACIL